MDTSYKLPYRFILVVFLLCGGLASQYSQEKVPQTLNYQAVARDSLDNPIANKDIVIEISILQGDSRTLVWQETHSVTTDKYGVFALLIGNGVTTAKGSKYSFSDINWETDDHYLRTRVDFGVENFGNGLIDMGTVKFQSVPYALVAEKALNAILKMEELTDAKMSNISKGNGAVYDGTNWVNKSVITADGQADLSGDWTISSNSIILSQGGVVTAKFTMGSTEITGITQDGTFPDDVVNHNNLATVQAVKEYVDLKAGDGSVWETRSNPGVVVNIQETSNRNFLFEGYEYTPGSDFDMDFGTGAKMFFIPKYGVFRAAGTNSSQTSWISSKLGGNSVGFGQDNLADGDFSFVHGKDSEASGKYSVVFGENCKLNSKSDYSVAFGYNHTIENAQFSLVSGESNIMNGEKSLCSGSSNEVDGASCITVGILNKLGSDISTPSASAVFGRENKVIEDFCLVYGSSNEGNGPGSLVGGYLSKVKAKYSVALGVGITANSFGEIAVGTYNENITANSPIEFDKSDNVFVVGYGESEGSRANALWVDKRGTTHVKDFDNLSDSIMKTMITPLPNSLNNVLQLRPVNFYWKDDFPVQEGEMPQKQIGLIAQEVEKIYPELVTNIPGRKLTMDYVSLTAVLIKAIQEQQQQIDSLKQASKSQDGEMVKLKAEYQNLQSRISTIEDLLNSSSSKE